MAMSYDEIYDMLEKLSLRASEEEFTAEEALELAKKEVERYEIEEYR